MTNASISPALDSDLKLIFAWRSNPEIYRYFRKQHGPLVWEEHLKWWQNRNDRKVFIISIEAELPQKVGVLCFEKLSSGIPEISIYVGETAFFGKGVATSAMSEGIEWLRKNGFKQTLAVVHKDNIGSQKLFKKLHFQLGQESQAEIWNEYRLSL